MGSGDDRFIDDERADVLMRRLLARVDQPIPPQPPDLVTRAMRRLPAVPPAQAAANAARSRRWRIALGAAALGVIVLVALIGMAGFISGSPQLALFFGNGGQGLSRALLMLHLLAKPIVRVVGAAGVPVMLAGLFGLLAGGWLWWRLLPAPVYAYAGSNRR